MQIAKRLKSIKEAISPAKSGEAKAHSGESKKGVKHFILKTIVTSVESGNSRNEANI